MTNFILRHKALVALFWLVLTVAGIATVGGTSHRMTNNFSMPGQAFRVDDRIVAEYGTGGSQAPHIPGLTVAPRQRVTDPSVAATTRRGFDAIRQGGGRQAARSLRLADYAGTGDRAVTTH